MRDELYGYIDEMPTVCQLCGEEVESNDDFCEICMRDFADVEIDVAKTMGWEAEDVLTSYFEGYPTDADGTCSYCRKPNCTEQAHCKAIVQRIIRQSGVDKDTIEQMAAQKYMW